MPCSAPRESLILARMKLTITLLLLTVTYHAESKLDNPQKYEHSEKFNSIEHYDDKTDPLQTNKIPVETPQMHYIGKWEGDYGKKSHNVRKEDYYNQNYYEKNTNEKRYHEVSRVGDQPHWEKNKYRYEDRKHEKYYEKEKYHTPKITDDLDPPNHTELIPMARYVMHNADWVSISTISTLPAIKGFPFTNIKSMVDGYVKNSTGVPYFYMSPLDFTTRDLKVNNRATIMVSLEETKFCAAKEYDPQDPRCTRIMLSGKVKAVKNTTSEYEFARGALFERHPAMASYPLDHDFFVTKMKIAQIAMVDWFGGAKYIPVRDYLAFNYTQLSLPKQ